MPSPIAATGAADSLLALDRGLTAQRLRRYRRETRLHVAKADFIGRVSGAGDRGRTSEVQIGSGGGKTRFPERRSLSHRPALFARAVLRSPATQNHRQRLQFTTQRIQRQAKRFQRERAEQGAVARLAENHIGSANALLVPEQRHALSTDNLAAVGENELFLAERANAESAQHGGGNNRIDCARVDQQLDWFPYAGLGGIPDVDCECGQPQEDSP